MDTLDIHILRRHPNEFTRVECTFCGKVAARWNGAVGADTACSACDDAFEAQYALQGGQ